jgi:hypothetical protein
MKAYKYTPAGLDVFLINTPESGEIVKPVNLVNVPRPIRGLTYVDNGRGVFLVSLQSLEPIKTTGVAR